MALNHNIGNKMLANIQRYSKATLIKTGNKTTHNPPITTNFGSKTDVSWGAAHNSKIVSSNVLFDGLEPGSDPNVIVIEPTSYLSGESPSGAITHYVHEYHQAFAVGSGRIIVNSHKNSTRTYRFVIFDFYPTDDLDITYDIAVDVGDGWEWNLELAYEKIYQKVYVEDDYFIDGIMRIRLNGPYGTIRVVTARGSDYITANEHHDWDFQVKYDSTGINERKIAFDLDIHKEESLDFETMGSITTKFNYSLEEKTAWLI